MRAQEIAGRAARIVGLALVAVALVYLGFVLHAHYDAVRGLDLGARFWALAVVSSLPYALFLLVLASTWAVLVSGRVRAWDRIKPLVAIYGRSACAKYLPGNVFHLVGRQVLGSWEGYGQPQLALASAAEIFVSIVGAGSVAVLLLAFSPLAPASRAALLPAVCGAVVFVSVLLGRRFVRLQRNDSRLAGLVHSLLGLPLFTAMLLSVLSFGMLAAIAGLCGGIVFGQDVRIARVAGAYLIAWLSGFVVPGAAGGVGIREAVLVAQLGPDFGEASALAFALLMRLQSVFGDVLLLCLSLAASKRLRGTDKAARAARADEVDELDEVEASSRSS